MPAASERRACRVLVVSRWGPRPADPPAPRTKVVDGHLAELIRSLIARHATAGYRLLWALRRREHGVVVARKTVYRILKLKGWLVHQRSKTPRPRVRGLVSKAARSNERWTMGLTHIFVSFAHARREVLTWIRWYNARRPHTALGYKSPAEYRAQQEPEVA